MIRAMIVFLALLGSTSSAHADLLIRKVQMSEKGFKVQNCQSLNWVTIGEGKIRFSAGNECEFDLEPGILRTNLDMTLGEFYTFLVRASSDDKVTHGLTFFIQSEKEKAKGASDYFVIEFPPARIME